MSLKMWVTLLSYGKAAHVGRIARGINSQPKMLKLCQAYGAVRLC
jgi:hypothetical protein